MKILWTSATFGQDDSGAASIEAVVLTALVITLCVLIFQSLSDAVVDWAGQLSQGASMQTSFVDAAE
ncbi:hypothetical protein [Falsigemmobacter faecalis]|uniref:Uncharacterized protein n=1 Tax=Falsigemmobacter faecalis TaxID=2488730 RepID=A0A3P3DRM2_9RHOB|nr:hypothetical protein [Falsigemmobacter faecalis]RRH76336.1 hypothetical protein EG244_06150 [Falsigemmobacter faecalis]